MYIVVRKSQKGIKKISDEKKQLNEIVPIDQRISLDVAEVVDHHEKTKAAYNRIYYVSDGQMQIYFNNQHINLEKGDACFVEKGMSFELKGTFSVIIVSHPPLYI
jgi:mannose-6-phosphate isomerase class I